MNKKLKELIDSIGMMTELWMITYEGFKRQGLTETAALLHTREFMIAFLTHARMADNEDKTDGET